MALIPPFFQFFIACQSEFFLFISNESIKEIRFIFDFIHPLYLHAEKEENGNKKKKNTETNFFPVRDHKTTALWKALS